MRAGRPKKNSEKAKYKQRERDTAKRISDTLANIPITQRLDTAMLHDRFDAWWACVVDIADLRTPDPDLVVPHIQGMQEMLAQDETLRCFLWAVLCAFSLPAIVDGCRDRPCTHRDIDEATTDCRELIENSRYCPGFWRNNIDDYIRRESGQWTTKLYTRVEIREALAMGESTFVNRMKEPEYQAAIRMKPGLPRKLKRTWQVCPDRFSRLKSADLPGANAHIRLIDPA